MVEIEKDVFGNVISASAYGSGKSICMNTLFACVCVFVYVCVYVEEGQHLN